MSEISKIAVDNVNYDVKDTTARAAAEAAATKAATVQTNVDNLSAAVVKKINDIQDVPSIFGVKTEDGSNLIVSGSAEVIMGEHNGDNFEINLYVGDESGNNEVLSAYKNANSEGVSLSTGSSNEVLYAYKDANSESVSLYTGGSNEVLYAYKDANSESVSLSTGSNEVLYAYKSANSESVSLEINGDYRLKIEQKPNQEGNVLYTFFDIYGDAHAALEISEYETYFYDVANSYDLLYYNRDDYAFVLGDRQDAIHAHLVLGSAGEESSLYHNGTDFYELSSGFYEFDNFDALRIEGWTSYLPAYEYGQLGYMAGVYRCEVKVNNNGVIDFGITPDLTLKQLQALYYYGSHIFISAKYSDGSLKYIHVNNLEIERNSQGNYDILHTGCDDYAQSSKLLHNLIKNYLEA